MIKPHSPYLIIDGYVDEPTCLGVPFYISTYIRYVAGAIRSAKKPKFSDIKYQTIDQIRQDNYWLIDTDFCVLISGNPVPGKYLGGLPITLNEIETIAEKNPKAIIFLGGPIRFENITFKHSNLKLINYDIESFCYDYLSGITTTSRTRTIDEINRFSVEGAFIVEQHPRYPEVIIEIETGRGCPRKTHCSFCLEGSFNVHFREPKSVINEIIELYQHGVRHFRIGKQADLYSYQTQFKEWRNGFPDPNPEAINRLYSGIREKVPDLQTLHLDNVNPGTIFHYPELSKQITKIITENNTPGDVAAFGLESADPEVIKVNHLKASPEQVKFSIELINEFGGRRENGIPKLLPGINLIRGLPGENRETFRLNYEFLLDIFQSSLLLRRINIRQIKPNPATSVQFTTPTSKQEKKLDAAFRKYRKMIRDEIDHPLLKKVFPQGTKIQNVIIEQHRGDWSLARNIGSYPIVVNLPIHYDIFSKHDIVVIGYRERSLVGLTTPIIPDHLSYQEIKQIPGLSKQAGKLVSQGKLVKNDLVLSTIYTQLKNFIKD